MWRRGLGRSVMGGRERMGDREGEGMEEIKERRQGRGSRKLTRIISCECVHCVFFRWPKATIFAKF